MSFSFCFITLRSGPSVWRSRSSSARRLNDRAFTGEVSTFLNGPIQLPMTAATMRALSMVPRAYRPYGLEGGGGGNRSEENEEDSPTHNTRTRFRYCLLLQDRDTHTGKRRSGSAEGENGRSWARTATEAAEPEQPRRRRAGCQTKLAKVSSILRVQQPPFGEMASPAPRPFRVNPDISAG
ncbi:unnamed protein product [Nesidiocoris tenuis]|uniref:Uncharacterized protein n=1 Tax=Nesidiocoris tenuis TaxID=355587 RepID=A0A6H5GF80_9HEMI|nr:unnamed protein product [Nesidiocoris tenuis]